jgi:hypothetical protein
MKAQANSQRPTANSQRPTANSQPPEATTRLYALPMPSDLPLSDHPDGVLLDVWVVPGASRDEVAGMHDGALRVRVAAPPEGGKANRAAARLVAAVLGARRGRVVTGKAARRKQILLSGVAPDEAAERLRRMG